MGKKIDFSEYPEALVPTTKLDHSNDELPIYSGKFFLSIESLRVELTGNLKFTWVPELQIKFEALVITNPNDALDLFVRDDSKQLKIEILKLGINNNAIVTRGYFKERGELIIIGMVVPPFITGNPKDQTDYVRFEIPNLREIPGKAVQSDNKMLSMRRLDFSIPDYHLYIDFIVKNDLAQIYQYEKGGYFLTYTGYLRPNKPRHQNIKSIKVVLSCFNEFITFMNGRRCSTLFHKGYKDDQIVWQDYTPYFNESYKQVTSWVSNLPAVDNQLLSLWINFHRLCEDDSDRKCLKNVLHWYSEANSNSTDLEGSIVLLQNALELLFHWIIAEKHKYVGEQDAEKISAEAKTSFLLSLMNIDPAIPSQLIHLTKFASANNHINGPSAFISIRNAIVHPRKKNRDKLNKLLNVTIYEALNLGLFYVEIILLKHLGYKGHYKNRCKLLYEKYEFADLIE